MTFMFSKFVFVRTRLGLYSFNGQISVNQRDARYCTKSVTIELQYPI
jgi:hypothetical protein